MFINQSAKENIQTTSKPVRQRKQKAIKRYRYSHIYQADTSRKCNQRRHTGTQKTDC